MQKIDIFCRLKSFSSVSKGEMPFAVLAKQKPQNSGESVLAVQILAGQVLLILEPELINGSRKMSIKLNVENQFKELIVTPGVRQ